MAKRNKKTLEKKNWSNSFVLIGEAKINEYTFKLDEKSEKSDWVYNSLNLGVYCGETCGTVYAEIMGGYGAERDNVIYVHGKDEEGKDDFDKGSAGTDGGQRKKLEKADSEYSHQPPGQ